VAKDAGRKKRRRAGKDARGRERLRVGGQVYVLHVDLIAGYVFEDFWKANPEVSRTIEILGSQSLEELHWAVFDAFDRFDEHMYEFQVGGERPQDRKARSYVMPETMGGFFGEETHAGVTTRTTVASLGLEPGQTFYYWFDFGDDWWHEIRVLAIREQAEEGKYPRVTERVGPSPPQYPNMEDEGDEDWDDEDEEDWDEEEEDDEEDRA